MYLTQNATRAFALRCVVSKYIARKALQALLLLAIHFRDGLIVEDVYGGRRYLL